MLMGNQREHKDVICDNKNRKGKRAVWELSFSVLLNLVWY